MKRLIAVLVFTVMMIVNAVAMSDDVLEDYFDMFSMYVICNDTSVNIREKPSMKAKKCGYLEFGWEVEAADIVKDKSGQEWYLIVGNTEQGYGYVNASYLVDTKPEKVDAYYYVETNGRVMLYDRINGKRIGWAKNGESLYVKVMSDEWALTDRGWIRTEHIAPDVSL